MTATTLYVATNGDDGNPGTEQAPFLTLERARDAVRELKAGGLSGGGVTVWLRSGFYEQSATFRLDEGDSGTLESPVTFAAFPGERPRISGGRQIPSLSFRPVTDPGILKRIQPAVRDRILCVDLRAHGITDFGRMETRGFNNVRKPMPLLLYCDGRPMPLARWPDEGYARSGAVPGAGALSGDRASAQGKVFTLSGDRLKKWTTATDAWLHGFWHWDWADEYLPVQSVSVQDHSITMAQAPQFGIKAGCRFYILNLLEELDRPGEWYLDRGRGLLCFYPPVPLQDAEVVVTLLSDPLVFLNNCSHVSLRGLTIEHGRSSGITVLGGEHNRVAGCTLRNLSTMAIRIGEPWEYGDTARNGNGGRDNGVQSCDIYNIGGAGIILSGGDRKSLEPAGNFAVNNHIHHCSQICRTYQPAIEVNGVGNRVSRNDIHDAPHYAVWLTGNDHIIELNRISNVVLETDDAGAVYAGRNPSERGNVIRYNHFHDIGNRLGHGTAAIYLDDGECGVLITGNIFHRAGNTGRAGFGAIFIHGGKDNVIEDNIFVDCEQAVGVEPWKGAFWREFLEGSYEDGLIPRRIFGGEVDVRKPPFSTRYPELAGLNAGIGRNRLRRNLLNRCGRFLSVDNQDSMNNLAGTWNIASRDGAQTEWLLEHCNIACKKIGGFAVIPVTRIGLFEDDFRGRQTA